MDGDNVNNLESFFRELADSIQKNSLSEDDIEKARNFYCEFNSVYSSNDCQSYKDSLKYLTMGWWVYQHILNNPSQLD